MTYTQHRDTQEVLATLDKLDIEIDEEILNNQEELYKRFYQFLIRHSTVKIISVFIYKFDCYAV